MKLCFYHTDTIILTKFYRCTMSMWLGSLNKSVAFSIKLDGIFKSYITEGKASNSPEHSETINFGLK